MKWWYVAGVLMMGSVCVEAADRMTDKDVKALIARIEEGRDRFDDALDGDVKRSIVRGPSGEVRVAQFLDDFQENIDRVEERLKPDYAASTEVSTLLRQGSLIDRYFRGLPAGTKGGSEWNRLADDLKALASAYGAVFPISEAATVRRMGDRELTTASDEIARGARRLRQSLDRELKANPAVDKTARENIVRQAERLSKDASGLRDRLKSGRPSSSEADRLLANAASLRPVLAAHQVPTAAREWDGLTTRLDAIAAAYRLPLVSAR